MTNLFLNRENLARDRQMRQMTIALPRMKIGVILRPVKIANHEMNALPLDQLTLETFAARLKTKFRVYLEAADFVELELVEASGTNTRSAAKPTAPFQESFSLIFNGPGSRLLPQNIYPFEHDALGRFDLFIVPVGQANGAFQYQAIFNRLVTPG